MNARWLLTIVLGLSAFAALRAFGPLTPPAEPPPLPADPSASPVELLYARPFELDVPYTHAWRAERPKVSAGHLLVLAVDPQLVAPRQTYEPVLYVGAQPAERINSGYGSGHLVVIAPATPGVELAEQPIFFGEPELPERIDAASATAQRERAVAQGLRGPGALLAERGADAVRFTDDYELRLYAADLVEQWAPDETDLIVGLRAPLLRR